MTLPRKSPFLRPRYRSLRFKLLVSLGLAGAASTIGLVLAYFAGIQMLGNAMRSNLNQTAMLMESMMLRDLNFLQYQTGNLAEQNALRVVIHLDLPAQAGRILKKSMGPGGFDYIWLLDIQGKTITTIPKGEAGDPPPLNAKRRGPVYMSRQGKLVVANAAPIFDNGRQIGTLITSTVFPPEGTIAEIQRLRPVRPHCFGPRRVCGKLAMA